MMLFASASGRPIEQHGNLLLLLLLLRITNYEEYIQYMYMYMVVLFYLTLFLDFCIMQYAM